MSQSGRREFSKKQNRRIQFNGRLIKTDRSGVVAGYVGQTALKVREVVQEAIGGVLFIDEAYALGGQQEQDFGPARLIPYSS